MAVHSLFSLLGLFWATFVDFGAACTRDTGGSGGSRKPFLWFSYEGLVFDALEMGREFSNRDEHGIPIM